MAVGVDDVAQAAGEFRGPVHQGAVLPEVPVPTA
jgi:hypothetical protein